MIPLTATPLLTGRTVASYSTSAAPSVLVLGRLAPGITLDQARAQLSAAWPAIKQAALPPGYTGARRDDFLSTALTVESGSLGAERVGNIVTLRYITDRSLLQERLTAMLSGFFGALALLLSAIGLYGLMSYDVAQRQREIGIRVAAGLAGALVAVQLVKSLLFGVTPHDPLTLAAAPASIILVALIACLVPAARAARVDPIVALRAE